MEVLWNVGKYPRNSLGPRCSLQHILIESLDWHEALHRALVKAGIHHQDEIEFRHDEYALTTEADGGRPSDLAPINERSAKPKGVTIEVRA